MNYTIEILDSLFTMFNYSYNKSKKTWIKENSKIIIVCEYQKSKYSNNFFINIGLYFKTPYRTNIKKVLIDDCQLISRYDQIYQDFKALEINDECFQNYELLKEELSDTWINIELKMLPMLDIMSDYDFMKKNYKDYPNEEWWLQNVVEEEYINFFKNM